LRHTLTIQLLLPTQFGIKDDSGLLLIPCEKFLCSNEGSFSKRIEGRLYHGKNDLLAIDCPFYQRMAHDFFVATEPMRLPRNGSLKSFKIASTRA
jgi:hypothetical protein